MDELHLIREEGFRAYVRYQGAGDRNPHTKASAEHQHFEDGWNQAALLCGHPKGKRKAKKTPPLRFRKASRRP